MWIARDGITSSLMSFGTTAFVGRFQMEGVGGDATPWQDVQAGGMMFFQ
jgi:hypothetical protein